MIRRSGILLFAAALALQGCGEQKPAPARPAPASGEQFTVRQVVIPDMKPVAAVVTSRNQAEARARIGGVLTKLAVREGDVVKRGQLVGLVVDQRIGLETRAYSAQAAAAAAENARAQSDLGRIRTLYEQGIYAKAKLDEAQAAAQAAAEGLRAARAQTAASAETAAQGAVLAPADGRVLHAQVPEGSVVTPGQSIATITAGQTVVRVEVPEAASEGLMLGQSVAISSQDLGPEVSNAKVVQLYPAVTAGKVSADLAAPGLKGELVGQRVRVQLEVGQRPALVAPRRFIVSRYGMDYARLVGRDGSANDVPVQLAPGPTPQDAEILSGLQAGDVIVRPGDAR